MLTCTEIVFPAAEFFHLNLNELNANETIKYHIDHQL
jgi:hypothetical protein